MAERIFTVGQLTKSIRNNLLANNPRIQGAWIEGEISGWKRYPSGNYYFTLKDATAQITCVLFGACVRSCGTSFRTLLQADGAQLNGIKVDVTGELDLTMARGQYSFKAYRMRLAGLGEKMAAFNALKQKLEVEGLNKLDHPARRRPLPPLPRHIGIVTSPAGAVIHDMCTVLTRRFPHLSIRLYPIKVQGEGAAKDIARGVAYFNACADDTSPEAWHPDLVIVGRGGGSAEDLWCFNEEEAVYAVAHCRVPVISAVGHESDTTLCDYVADLRAGTPSIAAERAVPVQGELLMRLDDLLKRLARAPIRRVETQAQQLDYLTLQLMRAPNEAVAAFVQRLERARLRLVPALREGANRAELRLSRMEPRLLPPLQNALEARGHRLAQAEAKLALLNPAETLKRGYSITLDAHGRVLSSRTAVHAGDRILTRFVDGDVASCVVEGEGV